MKFIKPHLRFIFSMLVIAVFLLITMATDLTQYLVSSTNTTVKIKNCETKPPIFGTLTVTITALDTNNLPAVTQNGKLYITHQKVNSDSCTYDVVSNLVVSYSTNSGGTFSYTGPDWMHDNSQDLWRVEIANYGVYSHPYRETQVGYYSNSTFHFTVKQLRPL